MRNVHDFLVNLAQVVLLSGPFAVLTTGSAVGLTAQDDHYLFKEVAAPGTSYATAERIGRRRHAEPYLTAHPADIQLFRLDIGRHEAPVLSRNI